MPKGFLLLAAFRSGSTWLVDVLNHVEGVTAYGELFALPEKQAGTEDLTRAQSEKTTRYLEQTIRAYPLYYQESRSRKVRPFSTFSYLSEFYEQGGTVGFKLMYTQLAQHPEIWAYVRLKGLAVVHLVRQNHLDVIISREMRKATRTTHRVTGAEDVKQVQVTLETESLVRNMRALQRNNDFARSLIKVSGVQGLELHYEELAQDARTFDPLWSFLEISSDNRQPESNLVKLVRGGYKESIANYSEVQAALQGTEFGQFFAGKQ